VLEAQADAKSRETDVIRAENDLTVSRQRLAQTAFYRPAATFVPRTLEPAEEATPEEVPIDVDQGITTALTDRPEIQASARNVQAQQLNERIAENGLLPRLDLTGSYGLNGTSGTNRPIVTTSSFASGNCVNNGNGTFTCNSPFSGPASDAYDRLVSNDFRSYSFGLQFQVPLSNALARGQVTQSRIARSQAELNHRQLLSNVTLDVRQSAADVTSARQGIDTTRVARALAEENLRNQEKRHEVGMATTKDLLDFQTRLTSARAAEVQAKIAFAVSVARWRRAQGHLLSYHQIMVEHPGRPGTPWFARF